VHPLALMTLENMAINFILTIVNVREIN